MSSPLIQTPRPFKHALTHPEARLWRLLRSAPPSGAAFLRQQVVGAWVATLYCPAARLAVEVDGFEHLDPEACAILARRRADLFREGVMELRVSSQELRRDPGRVLERIADCVEFRLAQTARQHSTPQVATPLAA